VRAGKLGRRGGKGQGVGFDGRGGPAVVMKRRENVWRNPGHSGAIFLLQAEPQPPAKRITWTKVALAFLRYLKHSTLKLSRFFH
jgi:hypothetical protein